LREFFIQPNFEFSVISFEIELLKKTRT